VADLTPAQGRVLRFIEEFLAERGFPPTHAEIARGLGFRSPNAATDHVKRLVARGALAAEPTRSRGLRLLAPSGLPLVGEVAAGLPILAQENVERQVEVDPALFRPRADFLLRVRGDSMIEAGIAPGDLLAVHKTPMARDGQIAVVRLDDDVTVKRFRRRAGAPHSPQSIVLEPANAALSPVVVDPARVQVAIEGVMVGLLRTGVAA
jgi:repressor LexA